ncbi:MAG: hypothetical protein A2174_01870 [Candidatus Portnoybacteria bacterium RBG_13_41_18]|uniref:D-alanine--D-alanine ligase n=1 Tax=Candidatus Portnoybacteria bacterium RBG_13_41_18 TaxID=1801991 RepID=A0A1G2F6M4_9BACT|nr:MAG: hypothetical protein A2174_01870 [Candidatus Portnoybacteria bacterium RBG_13_41_18]
MAGIKKKLNIVVLMGGPSAEHEVSLNTGRMISQALDKKKYNVKPVAITKEGNWLLLKEGVKLLVENNRSLSINDSVLARHGVSAIDEIKSKKSADVVFLALHGTYGEDGAIQGLLELAGIPYTGSGILASALGMDKSMAKKILKREKIPTPNYFIFTKNNHVSLKKVKFPCVVKPVAQGSSVGVTIVRGPGQLKKAIKNALTYGQRVMVEDFIEGREITATVIGNKKPKALPLIEIKPKLSSFYNYESKYADGGSEHICPAQIPPPVTKRIQELALRAHVTLGCRGVTRTDFILHGSQPYALEINTLPGMTSVSLVPQSAATAGIKFPELLDKLIELALEK